MSLENQVGFNQIEKICRAAKCNPADLSTLTTLDASGNSGITDEGVKGLQNLTTLYAGGNSGITDAWLAMVRNRRGEKC